MPFDGACLVNAPSDHHPRRRLDTNYRGSWGEPLYLDETVVLDVLLVLVLVVGVAFHWK